MTDVLGWVLNATLLAWLAAEAVMQVRQYRMGERARVTEWRSLGVIAVGIVGGLVLGELAAVALPGLRLPVGTGVLLAVAVPVVWVGVGLRLWRSARWAGSSVEWCTCRRTTRWCAPGRIA
jgi:hypothetical protein